jgi:signal transduction histidine kinase
LKIDSPELLELNHPLVRSAESGSNIVEPLFRLFSWAEVLIPLKVRDEQIGMLALSRPGRDGYFNLKQVSFLTQAAGVLAVGTENIFLFDSMRRQSRLRLVAQEEVRKNVSRQLHDQPLQQITYAVAIIDQLLAKHFSNVEDSEINAIAIAEVVSKLTVTGEYLRKSAVSLRNICRGLYPPFHDQGVDLAVGEIIHQFETEHGLNISFTSTLNAASWPKSEQVTVTVSHVLNESLNNIVKHAKGADVEVKIEATGEGQLILWVADNGPGNRTANLSFNELVKRGHLGIVGMHEWAQQIGGNLEILSNEPRGTSVLLSCPI